MEKFVLERYQQVPLEFDGDVIAFQSSQTEEPRWQELRIYRTASDKYVVQLTGKSNMPGERDMLNVWVVDEPVDVRKVLTRTKRGREFLTRLSINALDEAGANDPHFKDALIERI